MKKELQIMAGTSNTGSLIKELGYRNVLLTNKIAVSLYGLVNVKVLITKDMDEAEAKELLFTFSAGIEDFAFIAWFPQNKNQDCYTSNNFGIDQKMSEEFCINLISILGLKSLYGNQEESIAA